MDTVRIELHLPGGIDLETVLKMGQTFFWERCGDGFLGTVAGRLFFVRSVGQDRLQVLGNVSSEQARRLLEHYFAADRDYAAVRHALADDPVCRRAVEAFPGLRRLRQPFWECLAGFLLSSVNNIARIGRVVRTLAQRFGQRERVGSRTGWTFPSPGVFIDIPLEALYDCGTGFRARALVEAARRIAHGEWDPCALQRLPYAEARRQLMASYGIGPKIADCVLLYGLDRSEAFPVDVWMRRVLERLYFNGGPVPVDTALWKWARGRFGRWAGDAQLYLYHAARMGLYPDVAGVGRGAN